MKRPRRTPERAAWDHMIQRCTNPRSAGWKNYGGRGISICAEWRHDFGAFLVYIGLRPSPNHSIDRYPNNDGNYEPGNVRWATHSQQANNKRNNLLFNGDNKPIHDLLLRQVADIAGMTRNDCQKLFGLSGTQIDSWFTGKKPDPLNRAREFCSLLREQNRPDLILNVLGYVAGDDDFDGRVLTAEENAALKTLMGTK